MADNRIKVAGYAKKVVYNGGIEYRNFSDSLVGNQFTSDGGTTLFTAANFNITTNLDPKDSKIFTTKPFGDFVSLEDLKLTHEQAIEFIDTNTKIVLNIDKTDLTNYAYFGSLREFVRVSLESIIMNWPASLYVSPVNEFNPFLGGPAFENYVTDDLTGTATFSVNAARFVNKFNVNYTQTGQILNSFSDSNDLRNMAVNFNSYNVSTSTGDYPVLGFTGTTDLNKNVYFEVSGFPFTSSATTINYHIKPNDIKFEGFFSNLNVFESNLLNRLTTPAYTSNYKYSVETEQGNVIASEMTITWPVSDGYNIDFDTEHYVNFVGDLLTIADNNDLTNTNIMTRFLVSESITDFDTIDQKMGNTLRIYGREFDEVKRYIDGLAYANTVTYDGFKNTPDVVLKNLAKVMGWDLISSISEVDLVNNYLKTSTSTYEGHSRGLTAVEAEVELWRRIILNTPWIWKSKGTRKAIEFLFKFIGSPDGLVDFNEFIYVAKKSLDIDLFNEILVANSGTTGIDGLNIDSDGFPRVLPNTSEMYFQKGGLWYRETGGPNSNMDILTGNNPHIGPYDAGYEYINQFSCLIPDFQPVTLIEEKVVSGSTNIFVNYDNGTFGDCYVSGQTADYIEVLNQDNQEIDECILVTSEITQTYPEMVELDECGCPINQCDKASLRIHIRKLPTPQTDCGYTGFVLDEGGFILFTLYNGEETNFMSSECCTSLGFTPELQDGIYVCRWQEPAGICDGYTPTVIEDGYQVFIGPDGENTREVKATECCPIGTIPELVVGGNYMCKEDMVVEVVTCSGFTASSIMGDGTVVFNGPSGTTTFMEVECCTAFGFSAVTSGGKTVCKIACESYVSTTVGLDNYTVFTRANSTTYTEVPLPECCPVNTLAVPVTTSGGLNYYKCAQLETQRNCRYITYASFTNAGNAEAELAAFNGKYCDGTDFNFNRTLGPGEMSSQPINQCIDVDSLTFSSSNAAPHYNDSIECNIEI